MPENLNTNLTKYLANISWLENEVKQRSLDLKVAYRKVGTAYSQAWTRHHKTVEEQNAQTQLTYELSFGVLSCFAVGLASVLSSIKQAAKTTKVGPAAASELPSFEIHGVSEAAKNNYRNVKLPFMQERQIRLGQVFTEGVEDALQTGIEVGCQTAAKKAATSTYPINKPPLQFQNNLISAIESEEKASLKMCNDERTSAMERELGSFKGFDWKKHRKNLAAALATKQKLCKPKLPSVEDLSKQLECGLWALWVQLHCTDRMRVSFWGDPQKGKRRWTHADPGWTVEARLNKLGITKEAGIGKTFGCWTSRDEVLKLISWGKEYKPPKHLQF